MRPADWEEADENGIPIAGVLAGMAMFAWESVAHMLLPFGEMGISSLPNEAATRAALAAQLGRAEGLYFFPDMRPDEGGGGGALGAAGLSSQLDFSYSVMGWEAATELVQGVALALILGMTAAAGFGRRLGIAALVGVAAAFCVSPSYTIWFGFPIAYTAGQMIVASATISSARAGRLAAQAQGGERLKGEAIYLVMTSQEVRRWRQDARRVQRDARRLRDGGTPTRHETGRGGRGARARGNGSGLKKADKPTLKELLLADGAAIRDAEFPPSAVERGAAAAGFLKLYLLDTNVVSEIPEAEAAWRRHCLGARRRRLGVSISRR